MDGHSTSFPWILHHILEKECSDELPLRIMFTFNAGQQLPSLKQAHKWWQYEPKGKLIIQFLASLPPSETRSEAPPVKEPKENSRKLERISEVTEINEELLNNVGSPENSEFDEFMDSNHDLLFDVNLAEDPSSIHRSSMGRRTSGFPTHFIRNVCLNKVFLEDYSKADFTQALTCLDYLRDLECTRRTALREAALRLGINKNNWKAILNEEPEAYRWVSSVQKQELEIESSFAACYVDLRIWTMAHELQSTPFYKPNVLAMLNTLFPPAMKEMPNDKVDIKTINKYRATFYHHILAVEAKGSGIAKDFIQKLLEPKAKHGWSETRKHLEEYISLADTMISEAKAVEGIDYYHETSSSRHSRSASAARSSYSDRPQTASSANTSVDGWPQSSTFLAPNSPELTHHTDPKKSATGATSEKDILSPPPSEASKPHSPLSFRERAANAGGLKTTNGISTNRKSTPMKAPPPSITIPSPDKYAPGPKTSPLLPGRRLSSPTAPGFSKSDYKPLPEPIEEPAIKKSGFDFLTRPWHVHSLSNERDGAPPNCVGPKRKKSLTNFLGLRRKASVGHGGGLGSSGSITVPPTTGLVSGSASPTTLRPKIQHTRSSSEIVGLSGSTMESARQRAVSTSTSAPDVRRLLGKKSLPDFSAVMVPPSTSGSRLSDGNGDSLPPLPPLPVQVNGRMIIPRSSENLRELNREALKFDDAGFAPIDLDFRASTATRQSTLPPFTFSSAKSSPTKSSPTKSPDLPELMTGWNERVSMRASAAPAPLHIKKASDAKIEEEYLIQWSEFDRPRTAPKPPEGVKRMVVLDLGKFARAEERKKMGGNGG
ncbi:hypothetical protein HYFRA_00008673, partial [Hymenoscyphus fraxineus]